MQTAEDIIAQKDARIKELEAMVSSLERQLSWLQKRLFGKMSEKNLSLDPMALQGTLFEDQMTEEEKAAVAEMVERDKEEEAKVISVKGFERKVRKPVDTTALEVFVEDVYPELDNKDDYVELEPEVTDSIVHVPEKFYIRRIIRHKYVLKSSLQIKDPERQAFVLAPVPVMPLFKCMASASLLTDIILQKFMYHMPFYRVIQKYKEMGVKISDSTMNDWYAATCSKLKPLYDLLVEEIMGSGYIQVDESTLPVIDNEKHRAVKGYMWLVRSVSGGMVAFRYDMGSRSYETARKILRGYTGTIQTDGYGAYDQFEHSPNIRMLGCWAHVRRKFVDALEEDKLRASEALALINSLYHIENEAKELGLEGDALKDKRQREAYPIILTFDKWMLDTAGHVAEKSRIGMAIAYTYPLLGRLTLYVTDGKYRIDNNLIENAVRPLAIGRKNFLFCGNHDAAVRAAIVYSFIGTCKALGVDTRKWMEDILVRLTEYEADRTKDMRELLPHNWAKSHPEASTCPNS